MQPLYTALKVNNEIELCEVNDPDCRQLIERSLLKHRISYYIRWPKNTLFGRHKDACIFCVNDISREEAENIIHNICDEAGYSVKFIMKKSQNNYL